MNKRGPTVPVFLPPEIYAMQNTTSSKERTLKVQLLRGYFHEEGQQIEEGSIVELPEAEAKKAIKNGIATFPDED